MIPYVKPSCPRCGSRWAIYRQTTVLEWLCRACGHQWTEEPVKGEKGK